MENVNGRFYFKQMSNGNLIGEFSNSETSRNCTESADIVPESRKGDYIGNYLSTWQEDGTPCFAELEISEKLEHDKIFTIEWYEKGRKSLKFKGEGMLCDTILIGNYWGIKEKI